MNGKQFADLKNIPQKHETIWDILFVLSITISFIPKVSVIAIVFFAINILFFKHKQKISTTFLTISLIINLLVLLVLDPKMETALKNYKKIGYKISAYKQSQLKLSYYNQEIINYYKHYSIYPNSLNEIQNGYMDFADPSYLINIEDDNIYFAEYYYEKIDSLSYYLLGVGQDGIPKTDDDILPLVEKQDTLTTGLIKYTIKAKSMYY